MIPSTAALVNSNVPIRIESNLTDRKWIDENPVHGGTSILEAMTLGSATAGLPLAQACSKKPIRMIAPHPPGGTTDILTRIAGQKIGEAWNAPMALNPLFYPRIAYPSPGDFTPVSLIGAAPQLMVLNPSVPAKSFKELLALAKSSKEGLNYGGSGVGTLLHLGGEMFQIATGAKMVHVSSKGAVLVALDLIGGRLHLVFSDMPVALPHAKAGKLHALAVAGDIRDARIFAGLADRFTFTHQHVNLPELRNGLLWAILLACFY